MDERRDNDPFTIDEGNQDNQDDGASQGSQRRSTSLLERIQRQRELEAATAAVTTTTTGPATSNAIVNSTTMSSVPHHNIQPQIQVPQYGPMPGFGNNTSDTTTMPQATPPAPNHQSGYLNNTWNSFTQRMESSMMGERSQINSSPSYDNNNDEMHHALLPPASRNDYANQTTDEYSISQYFLTFVKDVYELFIWLPIAVRIVVVAGLLYVVVKFI